MSAIAIGGMAAGSYDHTCKLWDMRSGQVCMPACAHACNTLAWLCALYTWLFNCDLLGHLHSEQQNSGQGVTQLR